MGKINYVNLLKMFITVPRAQLHSINASLVVVSITLTSVQDRREAGKSSASTNHLPAFYQGQMWCSHRPHTCSV